MKRKLFYVAIMIILAAFSGCGGGGGSSSSTSTNSVELIEFNSAPDTEAYVNEKYTYNIDVQGNDELNITKPDWLSFNGESLVGTPMKSDIGDYNITITAYNVDDSNKSNIIVLDKVQQKFQISVKDVLLDFNSDFVFLPSYEIGYKGGTVPIEFIVTDYKRIQDYTIMFVRSIDGLTYDYTFGTVLIDVTHNIARIEADITIPENGTDSVVNQTISAYYIKDDKNVLIHAVNISQSNFIPEVQTYNITVDMTNSNGGYTLVQDPLTGDVKIQQNVHGMSESCVDAGWRWNQNMLVCIPPEDSPTYNDIVTCINNPESPNKWDFVTKSCYAEIYPDMTEQDACVLIGAQWDYSTNKCLVPSQGITNEQACLQLNGSWDGSTCTLP